MIDYISSKQNHNNNNNTKLTEEELNQNISYQIIKLTLKDFIRTVNTKFQSIRYKSFLELKTKGETRTAKKLNSEAIFQVLNTKINSILNIRERLITKAKIKKFLKWQSFVKFSKQIKTLVFELENEKTKVYEALVKNKNNDIERLKNKENEVVALYEKNRLEEKTVVEKLKEIRNEEVVVKSKYAEVDVSC